MQLSPCLQGGVSEPRLWGDSVQEDAESAEESDGAGNHQPLLRITESCDCAIGPDLRAGRSEIGPGVS